MRYATRSDGRSPADDAGRAARPPVASAPHGPGAVTSDPLWHTLPVDETGRLLDSPAGGLSAEEAARRRAESGPNELRAEPGPSAASILFQQFRNVLIVILLIGAGLSFGLGHATEAIAISVIVLLAVLLGFVQEYRAERALEALRRMSAPSARVLRAGRETTVPARDLVPGDRIVLRTGDLVPADARLAEAVQLRADEAVLTGESVPVEKGLAPLAAADLALGDRANLVFAGTSVSHGRATAIVVATGMRTEFGRIAGMLESIEKIRTPLQVELDRVGATLARAALGVVAVIVGLGLFRGQPLLEMLLFGVALAVAVVPEALPAVVTISLALGVQRMVHRNALVRRLPAVETLGSTSVICSDKTGTLTRNEMTVRSIVTREESVDVSGVGYEPTGAFTRDGREVPPSERVREILGAALLCSDARLAREDGSWHVQGDPTEGALVVAAAKAGLDQTALEAARPRVHEVPFTSERKRMATVHRDETGVVAYAKGGVEAVLEICSRHAGAAGEGSLTAADREHWVEAAGALSDRGLRVLGVARRRDATVETPEREMTFLGLVGMMDPARPEAASAVERCREARIRVVMITGDHPLTARAVARELGILRSGRVLTGPELDALPDADFLGVVEGVDVYARVSPAHKLRIVTALQELRHVAAMTGDGVNDAPALRRADIGIAMGRTGTDVTREAADMTLLDDNFATIVAAVEEGRGIFSNIKKYLMYLLSSNVGEILVVAAAAFGGLPMPLTAVQILCVNLATDGLPALALAFDPPASDLMRQPPRDPRGGLFTRSTVLLMLAGGVWSAIVNLTLFVWALSAGRPLAEAMTLTFVSLVLIQFFKAYNFRSDRQSVFERPFANRWLNLSVLVQVPFLVAIVHWTPLQAVFDTRSLDLADWAILVAVAATVSPVLEIAKRLLRGRG